MQKGQAFDAFKLLIAAVVAGAILVIILGIISQIIPPGADPPAVMKETLISVGQGGISKISTQVVTFDKGSSYEADAAARAAGMNVGSVVFCCTESVAEKCVGHAFSPDYFDCTPSELASKTSIKGNIFAYCPSVQAEKCVVGFDVAR